jgi:hypothetical protein
MSEYTADKSQMTTNPAWRSPGVWMSVILVVYILFNAARAILNPADFAVYFGLPLATPDNNAFVLVYAIRALFLGLFGAALLLRMDYRGLALYVLVGMVMPLGDALLVAYQGAATGTIIRHLLVAGFLLLTWFLLRRRIQAVSQPVQVSLSDQ